MATSRKPPDDAPPSEPRPAKPRPPQRRAKPTQTLAPARNFTLTLEDRVRALAGPPAYIVRKRAIEDLEEKHVATLRKLVQEAREHHPDDAAAVAAEVEEAALRIDLSRANALINLHNRYYPCEANLPMDPPTGRYLEAGLPWVPLARMTFETLLRSLNQVVFEDE